MSADKTLNYHKHYNESGSIMPRKH